jgi:hypothetical protein
MNQQVNCPSLNKNRPSQTPQDRIKLPSYRDPQRQHRYPAISLYCPSPRIKTIFPLQQVKEIQVPPIIFPLRHKQKRKQRRMEYYFSRILVHPPVNPQIPQQQSAINSIPNKYVNRSFGSSDSLDPLD